MSIVVDKKIVEILKKIESAYKLQNEYYQKSCEQVVIIGKYLLGVDTHFKNNPDAELSFMENLPFQSSMVSKYKQIARHPVLSNLKNLKSLPSSMSTLYEFSKTDEKSLLDAIKSGEVSISSTRADASRFAVLNPKISTGGRGAPVKSLIPLNFSQIKISPDCDVDEQDKILQELLKIKERHPSFLLKIASDISGRYKDEMKSSATNAIQQIIKNQNSDKQKLSNLLSNAIFESRKNKDILPKNYKWRNRLEKEVGIDASGEVRVSQLYKVARNEGVVTRYTPIGEIDPIAGVWAQVLNYCEGDKSALTKLRKFIEKEPEKPNAKFNKAQDLAINLIKQIETL